MLSWGQGLRWKLCVYTLYRQAILALQQYGEKRCREKVQLAHSSHLRCHVGLLERRKALEGMFLMIWPENMVHKNHELQPLQNICDCNLLYCSRLLQARTV